MDVDKDKCKGCGQCIEVCDSEAIQYEAGRKSGYKGVVIDQSLCVNCGCCTEVCPGEAIS